MASLQDQNTVARRLVLELREGLVRSFARKLLRNACRDLRLSRAPLATFQVRLERMESCGGAPPALSRELAHKSEELCAAAAQMDRALRQLALHDASGAKRDLWKVRCLAFVVLANLCSSAADLLCSFATTAQG